MSGVSSGFKNTAFYEAERKQTTLSHSDFAREADFEDLNRCDALTDYLLSKDYDKHFRIEGKIVTVDTEIANRIFYECHQKFKSEIDSVQLFDILTRFYNIDEVVLFNKLVKKLRTILTDDLRSRIDIDSPKIKKLDAYHIQGSLNAIKR